MHYSYKSAILYLIDDSYNLQQRNEDIKYMFMNEAILKEIEINCEFKVEDIEWSNNQNDIICEA